MTPDDDPRKGLPSASSLERLALCPGSPLSGEGYRPPSDKAMAASGDRIHLHLQAPDIYQLDDPEEQEIADALRKREADVKEAVWGDANKADLKEVREKRLWMKDENGNLIFSGKPDVMYGFGGVALVLNYKTGRGDHEDSDSNLQVRAEVVLLHHTQHLECSQIFAAILSPYKKPAVAFYEPATLKGATDQVRRILRKAKPGAKRVPGPKQCRFCPARLTCRELHGSIEDIAKLKKDGLKPKVLAGLLDKLAAVKPLIKAAESAAKEFINSGEEVPGWTLSKPRTTVSITHPEKALGILLGAGLITQDEFMKHIKVQLGGIEKHVWSATEGLSMNQAKAKVRDILCEVIEQKVTSGSLVKEKKEDE